MSQVVDIPRLPCISLHVDSDDQLAGRSCRSKEMTYLGITINGSD